MGEEESNEEVWGGDTRVGVRKGHVSMSLSLNATVLLCLYVSTPLYVSVCMRTFSHLWDIHSLHHHRLHLRIRQTHL